MSDPYPENLKVEIDREGLRRYLRAKWFFAWVLPLAFFGGMIGFGSIANAYDHGTVSRSDVLFLGLKHSAIGLGTSLLIALLCYFGFSHRIASRLSTTLEVSVEGAFLRVRQRAAVLSDRKLHFRCIVDYTVTQDFLMRHFAIHALQMATTAGGQNTNVIVPGVKDCLRVRDLLADIDCQRENL